MALRCRKCHGEVDVIGTQVSRCKCGFTVAAYSAANTKVWRIAQTEKALASINEAIKQLQFLVDSYEESEGPFSGCHPRCAYQSQIRTLKQQAKSLEKGRV